MSVRRKSWSDASFSSSGGGGGGNNAEGWRSTSTLSSSSHNANAISGVAPLSACVVANQFQPRSQQVAPRSSLLSCVSSLGGLQSSLTGPDWLRMLRQQKVNRSTAERSKRLDDLHGEVRLLRRNNLTALIDTSYQRWVALLHHRRAARRERQHKLARVCCEKLLQCSSRVMMRRYFNTLRKWSRVAGPRRDLQTFLTKIRRDGLKTLVRRYFQTWQRWTPRHRQYQCVQKCHVESQNALTRRFFHSWIRFHERTRRYVRTVLPALRHIHRSALRVFLRSSLHRWWCSVEWRQNRRLQAEDLARLNTSRFALQIFLRWKRRRFLHAQGQAAVRMMRRNMRNLARCTFRAWMHWTAQQRIALHLEQNNFRLLASRYLYVWQRVVVSKRNLRHLRRKVDSWRRDHAFQTWQRFFFRNMRACMLEQRHFVCLLQRYYSEWKLQVLSTRLLYQQQHSSARSLTSSRSNSTQSHSRQNLKSIAL